MRLLRYIFASGLVVAAAQAQQTPLPAPVVVAVPGFKPAAPTAATPAAASPATAAKPSASTKPSNPEAAQLVYQAQIALDRKNPDDAQKLLDSAKALNDEEMRLWSTYGYLALARKDKPAAAADFEKELVLHPQVPEVYGSLAELQDDLGQRTEEEATLNRLIELDARYATAAARLVHMLVEDGRAADAVKLGKDAAAKFAAALPNAPRLSPRAVDSLEFELSKAEMAAGMKDESIATLVALLKITDNPAILNDGAYRLAVAGVELPLAETSARSVVLRAEVDTRRVTIDTDPRLQRQVMNGVVSVWDTLGWVLYRENKLDDAEGYARSAWLQKQDLTIGSHLATIEAAKGDKNMALTVCEVSLAHAASAAAKPALEKAVAEKPVPDKPKPAVKVPETKPGEVDTAGLQAQADALRRTGAVSRGQAGLDALLTQTIAPIRGSAGRGEFALMMGFGIIELANPLANNNATGLLSGLLGAKVTGLWPKDSGARLFMKSTVTCRPGGCTLELHDLD